MAAGLAELFLPPTRGAGAVDGQGGTCTVWTPGAPPTCTVVVGAVTYQGLPVLNAAAMATGAVLLLNTPAGPIVLGPLTATI